MQSRTAYALMVTAAMIALSGCTSEWDMQGVDPKDFYKAHPVKNTVETRDMSVMIQFEPYQTKLTSDEADRLRAALRGISPLAVDVVHVQMSASDLRNGVRRQNLTKLMRGMGYTRAAFMYEPSAEMARDDVQLQIEYLQVVTPKCPDWRTDSVTTYSNTIQGNFGCSQETNLGMMVADPHDLVAGSGTSSPDAERNYKVISDYRTGGNSSTSTSQGGSSNNSTGDSASSGSTGSAVASGTAGLSGQ